MTDTTDPLKVLEATTEMLQALTAKLGDFGTAGDSRSDDEIKSIVDRYIVHVMWTGDGWWLHSDCKRAPAHPRRIGGPISPVSTGLHTTDMTPKTLAGLIQRWQSDPGDGACAHFVVGRTKAEGVTQLVPILRNGNHLGGAHHGSFVINGKMIHPNTVTTGIEMHCAGGVVRVGDAWRLVEGGHAVGEVLPDEDVIPDPLRVGHGVHRLTDYQLEITKTLLRDLDAAQSPLPAGTRTMTCAGADPIPPWAQRTSRRIVTHVEMDPTDRSDPWRHGLAWLRSFAP